MASDVPVSTDLANETRLDDIRQALMTLASAKGILADLRVSVVNTVPTTISSGTVTTVSTLTSQTNQVQMGGLQLANTVPNWQNQTSVLSFTNNIVRS